MFEQEKLMIFDGACGTNLQDMDIPESVWHGNEGCNEYLNVSAPELIVDWHTSFLKAGAMALETNTFGASRVVLAEYGLEDRVREINEAAVANARRAIGDQTGRYVVGSVGPGTKLPSLGHISVDDLAAAAREQIQALVEAGVDALIIETCQDLLQVKTVVVACFDVLAQVGKDLPVLVSVTVENQGTLLVGSDIAAVAATLEPFPIFSLGLNCATGPAHMESYIRFLNKNWGKRISCMPNQGLPEVVDGKTVYSMSPQDFADHMKRFVAKDGVSVVGGCCGTTPAHIEALVKALEGVSPAARAPVPVSSAVSSLYQAVDLAQDIRPLLIGERSNSNGSREFRDLLLAEDFEGCLRIGLDQEAKGAQVLDLCSAYAGRDEKADLAKLVTMYAGSVRVPLVIDSTIPDCIEACLKLYPGRCIINSINLEDGGKNLHRICDMARRYGAAVVALTINEQGMAMTTADKVETAKRIYDLAVNGHGLRAHDILFDMLTFTIGSGDETLRDAGGQTIEAIRQIKQELPGVFTVLGVSNISFGLRPPARKVLNSVMVHECVAAGLDAAIVDAAKIVPLAQIDDEEKELALDLLYDRVKDPNKKPLMVFIDFYEGKVDDEETDDSQSYKQAETQLTQKILKGDKEGLDDVLAMLMARYKPLAIINEILVPAMREVGELFGRGDMLLPFVLQSAEVMKRSVAILEPFMERAEADESIKILLATVQGDVHDIGKNLVDIILSNNGYTVYNIGIKVPAETIIEKALEYKVDMIGLSGLLVKSAIVMQESMPQYKEAGLNVPILLGGAALTKKFVAESCVPNYDGPVVYCADAFAGLRSVQAHEEGTLKSTEFSGRVRPVTDLPQQQAVEVRRDNIIPDAPFLGVRHVTDVDSAKLFPYVNQQALFRGRWGYRRNKMDAQAYEDLIQGTVQPMYDELVARSIKEGLIQPKIAYGYFKCYRQDNAVMVCTDTETHAFEFPRQTMPPYQCISDYFRQQDEGGDVVGFFVVTIGDRIDEEIRKLFEADAYHDYLVMHGFSVEVTDALAEHWHEIMREELGFGAKPDDVTGYVTQQYQGSRYGFGYPACPDLDIHKVLFKLLEPEKIGVTLTEGMQMVPEQTTSAIVVHHPQAKYFAV
ncbi:MAG: methionine synthase [Phycisphaerae bacterium]|nr:methionine synthase [Phycisphaerae bacterium]